LAESRCSHWVVRKISFVVVRGYSPPAEGLQGLAFRILMPKP
jgi:hypothetical protein